MILHAPAKVNLYLRVLNKRSDGYHNIETVFERIALFDRIVLRPLKEKKIKISCDNPGVPVGKTSLIYKTVNLLKRELGVSKGVEVKIFKKIPVASGLGGGSSNAASVLTGLNKFWELHLGLDRLLEFGKSLGADVPFFVRERSFAVAKGRGDDITPLSWRGKFWHLVISPPVKLLSKDVYSTYARGVYSKTRNRSSFPRNDLEDVVIKKEPVLAKVKNVLERIGVTHSLVSGSGPSVFSLFRKRKEAIRARELLLKCFPCVKDKGWQMFIVSTF